MSPEEETVINRNTMKLQDHLYKALKQRDQYKAERDTLNDKLNQAYEDNYKLEGQLHDMTKQRDTLIDDVKNLREQCKEYAQDASKYTTLTNHIRMKAEHNPGVSRYIDLVNYIDRLERD